MAVEALTLVSNPGSSSRKYGLYKSDKELARVHIEFEDGNVVSHITGRNFSKTAKEQISDLSKSLGLCLDLLTANKLLKTPEDVSRVAIRIVAPSAYFLQDRLIDETALDKLKDLAQQAPLHIGAALNEIQIIKKILPNCLIYGISDSAFHAKKPDYAWNYPIDLNIADELDIKRFGYHGISVQSVINQISEFDILPEKIIVCHLGSGSSVTAISNGISLDNTMGYSPLSGVMMATRSGDIDLIAVQRLANNKGLELLNQELNSKSGLLGISGRSSDIRDLLKYEAEGDYRSKLALDMFVYNLAKAVGQMASVLNGADLLVFSGTIGERSAEIRKRLVYHLDYLGFNIDNIRNNKCYEPKSLKIISPRTRVKSVYVVPTDESLEIAKKASFLS